MPSVSRTPRHGPPHHRPEHGDHMPRRSKKKEAARGVDRLPRTSFAAEPVLSDADGMILEITVVTEAERLLLKDFRDFQRRQPRSLYLHMTSSQIRLERAPPPTHEGRVSCEPARSDSSRGSSGRSSFVESLVDRASSQGHHDVSRDAAAARPTMGGLRSRSAPERGTADARGSPKRRSVRSWTRFF